MDSSDDEMNSSMEEEMIKNLIEDEMEEDDEAADDEEVAEGGEAEDEEAAENNDEEVDINPDVKQTLAFHDMGLDDRILKAIAKQGWQKPTQIQEKAIPLGLDGKDVLLRARTGSGKTAAYIIPIVQRLLHLKKNDENYNEQISALVLVPSRELSAQATRMIEQITKYCDIKAVDLSKCQKDQVKLMGPLLSNKPDFVVGTPTGVIAHLREGNLKDLHESLKFLVIDEADLLFSFGYKDDLEKLRTELKFSDSIQTFLMSATLSEEVDELKGLLLHNPISLNLQESRLALTDQLTQYHVISETDDDKYLLMYALMKLKLIRGKSIMFVNSITKCYRLKLFLEQFSIFPTVLNSELPLNSRCHVVEQFNQGLYDYIIATDESYMLASHEVMKGGEQVKDTDGKNKKKKKKVANYKKKKLAATKEYGVSRGIDFENVKNVINFDFPPTVDSYIHRVGRTARGDKTGTALSLVLPEENELLEACQKELAGETLNTDQHEPLKPYQFKMDEIDGLRYRCKDAIRSVTKTSIRDARLKELRSEILNSDKLKTYFQDNPHDLNVLRHDTVLRPRKIQRHMKNVPQYLIPTSLKSMYNSSAVSSVQHHPPPSHDVKLKRSKRAIKKRKRTDPLATSSKKPAI